MTLASLVGFTWVGVEYLTQHHPAFGAFTLVIGAATAGQQYYLSKTFARQLIRLEKKDPEAVRRYLHQWWICKHPATCPRCRGWLGGLVVGTGGWIAAFVVYDFNPAIIAQHIGLPETYALAVVFLFLTPIHGMIGRMGRFRKKSVWELPAVLETIGGLSALAAPLIAALAYGVWHN